MAISITEAVPELLSTTNAGSYASTAFTPVANALLILIAGVSDTTTNPGSVTNTGTSLVWNLLRVQGYGPGAAHNMYAYYAQVPASVSSSVITMNVTGDNGTGAAISILQVTGHNPTNPFAAYQMGASSVANPGWILNSRNTLNGQIGAIAVGRLPGGTAPSGWTELVDGNYSTPTNGLAIVVRNSGETNATVNYTMAATTSEGNWSAFWAEINEASVGTKANMLMQMGYGT